MPETYRILVTGSRDWGDDDILRRWLRRTVGNRPQNTEPVIVHGACPSGADAMADRLARDYGYKVERHPADWATYGRGAGPIRNAEMAAAGASVCLAFIRDSSRGATNCAREAEAAGIPTRRFTDDG